eukprot:1933075-Pyramimonas_sp.AAC.1
MPVVAQACGGGGRLAAVCMRPSDWRFRRAERDGARMRCALEAARLQRHMVYTGPRCVAAPTCERPARASSGARRPYGA